MKRLGLHRLASLTLVIAAALAVGASPALAAPFENAIADDSFLFVNIANCEALHEQFATTHAAELRKDPQMQPFLNGLRTELEKSFAELKDQTGVEFGKLWNLPKGQIVLSAGLKPGVPIPHVQLLADVGGQTEFANELLNKLSEELENKGLPKRSAGNLTCFQLKQSPPIEFCFTVHNNILALGIDAGALQQTLDRIENPRGSSLADSTQFRRFRDKFSGPGDVEIFVNLSRIIPLVSLAGIQAQNVVQTLGLDRFEYIGLSSTVGRNGFDIHSQSILTTQGQTAIFNLLNMPAKPTTPQAWVPPNVSSYSTFNWDLDLFYNTLSGIVDGFKPGTMQQVEIVVSNFPSPDNPFITSIKGDVIGPLGNRITTLSDLGESRGKSVSRTLIAWELDDADKFSTLLNNIMLLVGPFLETKTVKGATVYTYNVGQILEQMPDQNAPIPVGVVGFTVANSHLFLTTHIELLDNVLNFTGAGLSESPEFRKVASHFPANTSAISYARSDAQAQMLWQMIKSGQLSTILRQASQGAEGEWAELLDGWISALDGSTLPDFEKVKHHFTSSGSYSVMDDNGLYGKTFLLK